MATAEHTNDGKSKATGKAVSDTLRETVQDAAQTVGDAAATAREKAEAGLQGVQEMASGYLEQGREKARQIERTLEDRIRSQPVRALLVAAAAGALLGVLLVRRRSS